MTIRTSPDFFMFQIIINIITIWTSFRCIFWINTTISNWSLL